MPSSPEDRFDAVIAGGGVAGLTAATLLARGGMRVVCIDPQPPEGRWRVGESLDWSSPALLRRLGFERDRLTASGTATTKRAVRVVGSGGEVVTKGPASWLARRPFRFESDTAHLDRCRFDQEHYEMAVEAGVEVVVDHVVGISTDADAVSGVRTRTGRMFVADWYIDASGRRRLFSDALAVRPIEWGPKRTCLWTRIDDPIDFAGTVLHFDDRSPDAVWSWQIPLGTCLTSVGIVLDHRRFLRLRREGRTQSDVFAQVLSGFDIHDGDPMPAPEAVRARSYRPFVSSRVSGSNWLLVGEAAAFADPLASHGVTAALRTGSEAADLILEHRSPMRAGTALSAYDRRVRTVATLYNRAMESLVYDGSVRSAFGLRRTFWSYVSVGYLANALYTRLRPITRLRWWVFRSAVSMLHLWISACQRTATRSSQAARPHIRASDAARRLPAASRGRMRSPAGGRPKSRRASLTSR